MSALFGVAVHKTLPQGEDVGAIFWHDGEKYYVTKAELERVKNMPSTDEILGILDTWKRLAKPSEN